PSRSSSPLSPSLPLSPPLPPLLAANKSYRGQAVDIWAAGITLYCFLYGKVPFNAKVITELHDIIRNDQPEFPSSPEISPELKDLFARLLEKDATKRITIPEIRVSQNTRFSFYTLPYNYIPFNVSPNRNTRGCVRRIAAYRPRRRTAMRRSLSIKRRLPPPSNPSGRQFTYW
ncbi:Calcium/calmodulin-dependent protein kinase kinase 1, partial [Geodia barretti]